MDRLLRGSSSVLKSSSIIMWRLTLIGQIEAHLLQTESPGRCRRSPELSDDHELRPCEQGRQLSGRE